LKKKTVVNIERLLGEPEDDVGIDIRSQRQRTGTTKPQIYGSRIRPRSGSRCGATKGLKASVAAVRGVQDPGSAVDDASEDLP